MFFAYFTLQHNKVDCLHLGLALVFLTVQLFFVLKNNFKTVRQNDTNQMQLIENDFARMTKRSRV